jgi:hypothetical protein
MTQNKMTYSDTARHKEERKELAKTKKKKCGKKEEIGGFSSINKHKTETMLWHN